MLVRKISNNLQRYKIPIRPLLSHPMWHGWHILHCIDTHVVNFAFLRGISLNLISQHVKVKWQAGILLLPVYVFCSSFFVLLSVFIILLDDMFHSDFNATFLKLN